MCTLAELNMSGLSRSLVGIIYAVKVFDSSEIHNREFNEVNKQRAVIIFKRNTFAQIVSLYGCAALGFIAHKFTIN